MIYADLHCDTATEMYKQNLSFDSFLQVSRSRLTSYEKCIQCFAVFTDDGQKNGMERFRAVIQHLKSMISGERNLVPIITTEGGCVIEGSLDNLDELKKADVRIFGFVWNGKNELATGAVTDMQAPLTDFGKECAKKLEILGILPDVSHLSERGFYDLADCTSGKIIATHSNCRAICQHPRNLSDEQIKLIIERRGLIGLNLFPPFLGDEASIYSIIAHIEHLLSLGAEDVIALGCDFDGVDSLPLGITGADGIRDIGSLIAQRFSEDISEKLLYKNALKVLDIKREI